MMEILVSKRSERKEKKQYEKLNKELNRVHEHRSKEADEICFNLANENIKLRNKVTNRNLMIAGMIVGTCVAGFMTGCEMRQMKLDYENVIEQLKK